jgi:hypothetical protein
LEIEAIEGASDQFTPHVKHDYSFLEKSKFLYAYMVNKLNTDLHDRIIGIEGKNGFEAYRQVAQILEAVPENAAFIMSAELLQLATQHGPKVRDLRSLYGFRLLLKKKNAEYKKVIGSKPEDEQSRLIMWNVLDPESKRIAASDSVSGMTYDKMCNWIDMRYKCMSGSLEYKATGKDDPMGLALFAESDAFPSTLLSPRRSSTRLPSRPPTSMPSRRARAKARATAGATCATARAISPATAPAPRQYPPSL